MAKNYDGNKRLHYFPHTFQITGPGADNSSGQHENFKAFHNEFLNTGKYKGITGEIAVKNFDLPKEIYRKQGGAVLVQTGLANGPNGKPCDCAKTSLTYTFQLKDYPEKAGITGPDVFHVLEDIYTRLAEERGHKTYGENKQPSIEAVKKELPFTFSFDPLMLATQGFSGNGPTLREGPRATTFRKSLKPTLPGKDALERIGFVKEDGHYKLTPGKGSVNNEAPVTVAILDSTPSDAYTVFAGGLVDYWVDLATGYFEDLTSEPRTIEEKDPEKLNYPTLISFKKNLIDANNRWQLDGTLYEFDPDLESDGEILDHDYMQKYHGLMVAALVKQVAPNAKILLIRVLDDKGEAPNSFVCAALNLLCEWKEQKIVFKDTSERLVEDNLVINLSLGAYNSMDETVDYEEYLVSTNCLCSKGAVIAAATGNFSFKNHPLNPIEPAAFGYYDDTDHLDQKLISVAATGKVPNQFAWFSNQGNLGAPGYDVLIDLGAEVATNLKTSDGDTIMARQFKWSGTSFSTPLVSGAAALLLEKGVPAGDVKRKLWDNATPPTDWNGIKELNVAKALYP